MRIKSQKMKYRPTGRIIPSKHGILWVRRSDSHRIQLLASGHPLNPDFKKEKREESTIMKEKNKRNMFLKIRVSEEEMAAIKRKQQNSGIPTVSDFVRTMIFRGVIIHIDKPLLKSIRNLFSSIANNVNQIAIRANSTGNIYEEDIKQIQDEVSQILQILLKVQASVMRIKPKENLRKEIKEVYLNNSSSE